MSLKSVDDDLLFALQTPGNKRTEEELKLIHSFLCEFDSLPNHYKQNLRSLSYEARYEAYSANDSLFEENDPCLSWYILLSGSVSLRNSLLHPPACIGKQIPSSRRRNCRCLVLEASEMIALDYPETSIHTNALMSHPSVSREHSTTTEDSSSLNTLDSVLEADVSSLEESPTHDTNNECHEVRVNGKADSASQSSFSKDIDVDDSDEDLDEEDSISTHSSSSTVIKDVVIEVLKKDSEERCAEDLDALLEFTKSLQAFSNMTEPIRRALCRVMILASIEKSFTTVLDDGEKLDSWSVIINGQVQLKRNDDETILGMGDSFGVEANVQEQHHKGIMQTITDDCQFLFVTQEDYCEVVHQGKENIEKIYNDNGVCIMMKEKRELDGGSKKGKIVIRGNAKSLTRHLLEENIIDATYADDFLLTYRAFSNEPSEIFKQFLKWFDDELYKSKVIRVILLWVNNHFSDFECDHRMMVLLEEFEKKLKESKLQGEMKLFNIACSTKAKPRIISIIRSSSDADLGFRIAGGSQDNFPIYISSVTAGSLAEAKGVKRGDLLLEVNGQNFEKLNQDRAEAILRKNTELNLTLKTALFAFKEMLTELKNPHRKSKKMKGEKSFSYSLRGSRMSLTSMTESDGFDSNKKKGGTLGRATFKIKRMFKKETNFNDFMSRHGVDSQMSVDDTFLSVPGRKLMSGSSATIDTSSRAFRLTSSLSVSNPDLLEADDVDFTSLTEIPEDVIKVYRADQSFRFIFVNRDTTAGDATLIAYKEFAIVDNFDYALYKVSVQGGKFVKQSKLPEQWSKLSDITLGSRYYLKNTMNSEQLLPDENIPDLLKEANFSFLDLDCFEVALYLTRDDYEQFQLTEPTNFIEDLFKLKAELSKFKKFEDLVNRELFWVVTTLCKEPNVLLRSKIIKHFTKIAHHCKSLKNFNSTFALISGLGYRAVSRMKQSWEKVPAKSNRLFEELQALMDPSRNMSKYRTLLNEYLSHPPVIPYIPVVKKDLTFLHLGNDTKVDGLINFEKMRMIAKEVRNVCKLCSPDSQQIIPSAAAAQQRDTDRGLYQTLARRSRRSSFNNPKRLYEDQLNVRRVRQYMKTIDIVSDEEKLMEMSKAVEPAAVPTSTQIKRRHNNASAISSESPTRSSKTLPLSTGRSSTTSNNVSLRNNSEPFLHIPGNNAQGARKKSPSSTLPKYGVGPRSPQMITRKLLALSEEGLHEKKGESSQDYSPTSSPFPITRRNNQRISSENTNKNNNRFSLPPGAGISSVSEPSSPDGIFLSGVKKFFASNGDMRNIGRMPHSSTAVDGSPRSSSPALSGSNCSLINTTSSPRLQQRREEYKAKKATVEKSRNRGRLPADTVNTTDQRLYPSSALEAQQQKMTNLQFPRTPSIDSGLMSSGSLSADSTRYNPSDDVELFNYAHHPTPHPTHRPTHHAPVGAPLNHRSQRTQQGDPSSTDPSQISVPPRVGAPRHRLPRQHERRSEEGGDVDNVEQTFLFGFRGLRDPPRPDHKDPSYLPPSVSNLQFDWGEYPPDSTVMYQAPPSKHVTPMVSMQSHKDIQEFMTCGKHIDIHDNSTRRNTNDIENPGLIPYVFCLKNHPEAFLEEELVLELQKQLPVNRNMIWEYASDSIGGKKMMDTRSISDPSLNKMSDRRHPTGLMLSLRSRYSVSPVKNLKYQSPLNLQHFIHDLRSQHMSSTSDDIIGVDLTSGNNPKLLDGHNPPIGCHAARHWMDGSDPASIHQCNRLPNVVGLMNQTEHRGYNNGYSQHRPPSEPHIQPMYGVNASIYPHQSPSKQRRHGQGWRKSNQEWGETNLDGDSHLVKEAWNRSNNSPITPSPTEYAPHDHHSYPTSRSTQALHIMRDTTDERQSNIHINKHRGTYSPPTSHISSTVMQQSMNCVHNNHGSAVALADGHVIPCSWSTANLSTSGADDVACKTLPTYEEAIHYLSSNPSKRTIFPTDKHESKEQMSHV